jgi:adhesin/invasin
VSSADPGTGTITIDSVTATVDGTTFTDVAAVATQGGAVTANKTWIAFDVDITPLTALNLVSQPHTFTISVQVDDGGGLVPLPIPPNSGTVDWTFDAPDGTTPSGTCTLEAGGTCTVVQNSNVAGTGTLTATSLTVNYDGVDYGPIDLTAAGSGQSQDLTVPPTATKGWAGYTLTLDPPTAVNLWPAEPDHVVTLTLATFPPGSGLPVVGQDIDVTLTSSVATITGVSDGTFTPTTAVCTTDAAATCEVTVTSTGPGAATLSAVYEAMVGGVQVPVPGVDDAEKTWRTYRVRVTPTADENLLGSPHTFTVTVERSDNGSTWTPVQGAVPTLAVSSPGSISSQTCNAGTSAAGTCTAVVTSPSTGTATLTATYEGTIDGASADFEGDGDKTWIDYRVTVTPSTAENLVDTNHVLTVTVEIDRGSGFVPLVGAEPAVVATGVGQITGNTCTAGTTTNGTCRATIRSTQPGTTRVTASFEGAAAGGETDTFSDSGTKSWIDYRLTLDPKSATNNVGEPHTFVATLEVDDGTGFSPAAGETLGFSVRGVGSISSIQPAGPAGGSCTTDAAGKCRITVNSPTAGSLTITVTFQAQAGPTEQTFTFDAQKSWIGGGIPNTGADSRRLVQIAAGITLAGLLLLLAARRRRTRSADATA